MPGGSGAIYTAQTTELWSQEKMLHAEVINPGSKYFSLAPAAPRTGRCVEVSCWVSLALFLRAEARLSGGWEKELSGVLRSNANPDGPAGHRVTRSGREAARAGSAGRWGKEEERAGWLEVGRWGAFRSIHKDAIARAGREAHELRGAT